MSINYAHRGASSYAPENTMISFDKALLLGANGLELDLQKTKDSKIYITSFIYETLKKVKVIDKNIKISWLINDIINKSNMKQLLEINGSQICPKTTNITKKGIELANSNGLCVRLWDVENFETMQEVFEFNIDGMTANFSDKLKELMERINEK